MSAQSDPNDTAQDPHQDPYPGPYPGPAQGVYHFIIHTQAEASALSRIVELFALRGLVPDEVNCKRLGADELHIHIAIPDLPENTAASLAARMRNIISVMRVVLEPAPHV